MKKYFFITTAIFTSACIFTSCNKYMNVNTVKAYVSPDQVFSNYSYVQSELYGIYANMPDGFGNLNYEAATDNAEATNATDPSHQFDRGTWNQYSNPDDVWSTYFNAIRQANLFIQNKDTILGSIQYLLGQITGTDSSVYYNALNNVTFMQGEVYFLKAFFYFELVKRYAGVPILTTALDYSDPNAWNGIGRNSLDSCVRYIAALCDSAAAIIPQNLAPYGFYQTGRVTHGAAKALKARVLLYGASPLYRDNGSTSTWAQAASAAHDVIAMNQYSLDPNYTNLYGPNNMTSPELIFWRQYGNQNGESNPGSSAAGPNNMEYDNFPVVFQNVRGNSTTPTQNFVDQFEVLVYDNFGNLAGSRPFNWQSSDSLNPYLNRDPRLGYTVVYNGSTFANTVIQTFTGGNSGLPKLNATRTGYYLSKWMNQTVDLVNNTQPVHTWFYFRYAEILLDYAEAMYNAYGANADPQGYGLTALQALNQVRERVGMPDLTTLNQQLIERERNVEMGFEDHRRWDVRRWEEGTTYFNEPVYRIDIEQDASQLSGYSYTVLPLENRVFNPQMGWYPINQNEITKTGWSQNPGW